MKTNYLVIALLSVGLFQLSACDQTTDEGIIEENGLETVSELPSESSPFAISIDQFPVGELDLLH